MEFFTRITIISTTPASESPSPISIRPLRKIPGENIQWSIQREDGYLYADKSAYLERLLENEFGNIFFYITRPRRFGKSSFLQMAKHFFDGDESLFNDLQIGNRGNIDFFKKPAYRGFPEELKYQKWTRCPVIYLDFCEMEFDTIAAFKDSYYSMLRDIAQSYGLDYLKRESVITTSRLIIALEMKFKLQVVVLVDEYDSPFQNALEAKKDHKLAEEVRSFLSDLFANIKSQHRILRLVFIVGVSRLNWIRLQSAGNNYIDLTYEEEYAGAFGFTSEEIKDFHPEIVHQLELDNQEKIDEFLSQLRKEYDGYNFTFQYKDGEKKNVLNPVSTMKCLQKKEFGCFWSQTSSADEVIRRLYFSRKPLKDFEHSTISRDDIEEKRNPAVESVPLEILMLLYGYFTIESYDHKTKEVQLNFPNNEIRTALQRNIDNYKPNKDIFLSEEHGWLYELKWHMETGCIEGTMDILTKMFDTTFSKTLQKGIGEYSTTTRMIDKLKMAGIFCRESVKFMRFVRKKIKEAGDVDLMTEYLNTNFIMSIKYGHSAIQAMQQLIDYLRKYPDAFLEAINNLDKAWFVGINFESRKGGTLDQWVAIPFKNGTMCYDQCKASIDVFCGVIKKKNTTPS
jgi:hypothetical protein